MDVRDCRTVHRLPSSISRRFAERRPGSIGHITLREKCAGARSAGKPHAACDVAGAGNGLTVRLVRHSHRKRGETDRPRLRSTAPALDPTGLHQLGEIDRIVRYLRVVFIRQAAIVVARQYRLTRYLCAVQKLSKFLAELVRNIEFDPAYRPILAITILRRKTVAAGTPAAPCMVPRSPD